MKLEALTFMLDSFVIVILVFMGLRDDRRTAGEAHTSLFRTRDIDTDTAKTPPERPDWARDSSGTDVGR